MLLPFFLLVPTQNSQDLEKRACSRNSKPMKQAGETKTFRPISLCLLCVFYKILERLIYARAEAIIDLLLPGEQAGFRRGKSTVDKVVFFDRNDRGFFVDPTAAFDCQAPWPYLQAALDFCRIST